jgi:hypothetical protein
MGEGERRGIWRRWNLVVWMLVWGDLRVGLTFDDVGEISSVEVEHEDSRIRARGIMQL